MAAPADIKGFSFRRPKTPDHLSTSQMTRPLLVGTPPVTMTASPPERKSHPGAFEAGWPFRWTAGRGRRRFRSPSGTQPPSYSDV